MWICLNTPFCISLANKLSSLIETPLQLTLLEYLIADIREECDIRIFHIVGVCCYIVSTEVLYLIIVRRICYSHEFLELCIRRTVCYCLTWTCAEVISLCLCPCLVIVLVSLFIVLEWIYLYTLLYLLRITCHSHLIASVWCKRSQIKIVCITVLSLQLNRARCPLLCIPVPLFEGYVSSNIRTEDERAACFHVKVRLWSGVVLCKACLLCLVEHTEWLVERSFCCEVWTLQEIRINSILYIPSLF